MEQSRNIERSEVWKQIYKEVKTLPIDTKGMDAPDASSVTTSIEQLFLKLLPIHNVVGQSEQLSLCKCDKPSPDIMYGKTCTECCLEIK